MASESHSALTRIECPNCRSPIDQFNATTQSLVCPKCHATIAIGIGDPEVLSKGHRLPKPPRPVKLGAIATIANNKYTVLGRVLYRGREDGENFEWNEWMLGAEDGRILWLSFDENGFELSRKIRFTQPFNPHRSSALRVGDRGVSIHERYPAEVVGSEGELTWRAKPGDKFFVAEGAASGGYKYSIQATNEELEIYEGRAVAEKDLAQSFNDTQWLKAIQAGKNRVATLQMIAVICIAAALLSVFLALIAGLTGTASPPITVELSQTTPHDTFTIDFDSPRPAIIAVKLLNNTLPVNTYIDFDMSITSPSGEVDDLFSQEIWHETGSDEDGPWDESQYETSDMFVPTQAGTHTVDVSYDGTVLSSLTLQITVRRNHVMPTWFFIYAAVAGGMGILALAASAPRTTMRIISELMDD